MKTTFFILLLLFISGKVTAFQAYRFLDLLPSAKTSLTSGNSFLMPDQADGFLTQPSSISKHTLHDLSASYVSYFADVKLFSLTYVSDLPFVGTTGFFTQYHNYGDFNGMDELANETGKFSAYDFITGITTSIDIIENVQLGITSKFIVSSIEKYQSSAIAFDAGISKVFETEQLTIFSTIRHAGFQLSSYQKSEKLPISFNIGVAKKLQYLPITLGYEFSGINTYVSEKKNILSYGKIAIRIQSTPNLDLFISSDLGQRNDLKSSSGGGIDLTGINFGGRINFRKINFVYAYSNMGVLPSNHRVDISFNLGTYLNN